MTERGNQIDDLVSLMRDVFEQHGVQISMRLARIHAREAYSKGFRKQRDGENLTENHPVDEFICSECGLIMRDNARWEIDEDADGDETQYEFEIKYCPRCGVKIKETE